MSEPSTDEIYNAFIRGVCEVLAPPTKAFIEAVAWDYEDRYIYLEIHVGRILVWTGGITWGSILNHEKTWRYSIENPDAVEKTQTELIRRGVQQAKPW